MKTFKNTGIKEQFIVTTNGGRRLVAGVAIEHVETTALEGRGRVIWKRGQGGYHFYRQL